MMDSGFLHLVSGNVTADADRLPSPNIRGARVSSLLHESTLLAHVDPSGTKANRTILLPRLHESLAERNLSLPRAKPCIHTFSPLSETHLAGEVIHFQETKISTRSATRPPTFDTSIAFYDSAYTCISEPGSLQSDQTNLGSFNKFNITPAFGQLSITRPTCESMVTPRNLRIEGPPQSTGRSSTLPSIHSRPEEPTVFYSSRSEVVYCKLFSNISKPPLPLDSLNTSSLQPKSQPWPIEIRLPFTSTCSEATMVTTRLPECILSTAADPDGKETKSRNHLSRKRSRSRTASNVGSRRIHISEQRESHAEGLGHTADRPNWAIAPMVDSIPPSSPSARKRQKRNEKGKNSKRKGINGCRLEHDRSRRWSAPEGRTNIGRKPVSGWREENSSRRLTGSARRRRRGKRGSGLQPLLSQKLPSRMPVSGRNPVIIRDSSLNALKAFLSTSTSKVWNNRELSFRTCDDRNENSDILVVQRGQEGNDSDTRTKQDGFGYTAERISQPVESIRHLSDSFRNLGIHPSGYSGRVKHGSDLPACTSHGDGGHEMTTGAFIVSKFEIRRDVNHAVAEGRCVSEAVAMKTGFEFGSVEQNRCTVISNDPKSACLRLSAKDERRGRVGRRCG